MAVVGPPVTAMSGAPGTDVAVGAASTAAGDPSRADVPARLRICTTRNSAAGAAPQLKGGSARD
jgi:hypothetical protein